MKGLKRILTVFWVVLGAAFLFSFSFSGISFAAANQGGTLVENGFHGIFNKDGSKNSIDWSAGSYSKWDSRYRRSDGSEYTVTSVAVIREVGQTVLASGPGWKRVEPYTIVDIYIRTTYPDGSYIDTYSTTIKWTYGVTYIYDTPTQATPPPSSGNTSPPPSSGNTSPPNTYSPPPQTVPSKPIIDVRKFSASLEPSILRAGEKVTVVAEYTGTLVKPVKAAFPWGTYDLTDSQAGKSSGVFVVPAGTAPGEYQVTVSGVIGQSGLMDKTLTDTKTLVVDGRDMKNLVLGSEVVNTGQSVPVSVEIIGTPVGDVIAQADWGSACILTSTDGVHYAGTMIVPFGAPPGVWAINVKASLVQAGISQSREFVLSKNLQVRKPGILEDFTKQKPGEYDWSWFEQWYNPWGK